jgi:hypothetical protein
MEFQINFPRGIVDRDSLSWYSKGHDRVQHLLVGVDIGTDRTIAIIFLFTWLSLRSICFCIMVAVAGIVVVIGGG